MYYICYDFPKQRSEMMSIAMFTVMAAVTTFALPMTSRQHDVTWSTICPQDADLRPPHCADATGNDVTARNDVTEDATTTTSWVNATRRAVWTYYPFAYDAKLGWYTAAVISGLILVFLVCESFERAKYAFIDYWESR